MHLLCQQNGILKIREAELITGFKQKIKQYLTKVTDNSLSSLKIIVFW